ncbi:MAG TPA: hypothetical protein VMF57_00895 [Solirubrobacteraceae bacterium]|nr:hypothetical protein [Solirubrobacteraceae bacterium]
MSPFLTPIRRALALGVLAAAIAAGIALAVGGCAGSSTKNIAQASTRSLPFQTIFEAQSELTTDPGPTLDQLKRLGVDDVKVFMPWGSIAPDPLSRKRPQFDASSPGAYPAANWTTYDSIVRDAAARGIGLDLALEAPAPLWATGPGVPAGTASSFLGSWEPSAKQFGLFVAAVGARYSGHYKPPGASTPLPAVRFWSIWNEPNYGQQLAPQAIDNSTVESSPATYRSLLDAAWSALQSTGHAGNTILIGEVAPRGETGPGLPGNFSGMVPLQFIRALYCVDSSLKPLQGDQAALRGCPTTAAASKAFPADNPGLFQAAGFAFHPYPQGQVPPNVPTAPGDLGADYADLPQLGALQRTLDGALEAYGSSYRFPLYDTEFGYQTNPPEKILRAISPKQAAYYENWAEYISWRDPRVVSWDQYLLADPPPPSMFDTGIEFASGDPKVPLFQAFRMPIYLPVTAAKSGHDLEVWGCVRPAHYAMQGPHAPQFATIQLQSTTGGRWVTVKRVLLTDAYGYFEAPVDFPSSGNVRISWSYPHHGEKIHSRTVQITIR